MKPLLRITKNMIESIKDDLVQPHNVACERVGFIMCKTTSDGNIALAFDYFPVKDDQYIEDKNVGAKINNEAIRENMQRAIDKKCGVFHVHLHKSEYVPWFSYVDSDSLSELIPSFQAVSPNNLHGGLVLGERFGSLLALKPHSDKLNPGKVSIIGFPSIIRGGSNGY